MLTAEDPVNEVAKMLRYYKSEGVLCRLAASPQTMLPWLSQKARLMRPLRRRGVPTSEDWRRD